MSLSGQLPPATNNQIIKQFYRKTKLIQRNQIKTIWEATHIYTGDVVVAKVQSVGENHMNERTVLHEGKFLQTCQGSLGIPFLIWCGKDEVQKQVILIQQKLGKTLRQLLLQSPNKKLSLKSSILITIQLIKMLSCYHQKGYIHRYINLDTIQLGCGPRCDQLYFNDLIDSRSFYKKGTLQHIDKKSNMKLKKMTQFTSCNVLEGNQASRKDDMMSVVLVMLCLLKGELPWSKVSRKRDLASNSPKLDQKQQQLQQYEQDQQVPAQLKGLTLKKMSTSSPEQIKSVAEKIAHYLNGTFTEWKIQRKTELVRQIIQSYSGHKLFQGFPKQMLQIYLQVKQLQFTSKPNYSFYIQLLNSILIKRQMENDNIYQWMRHKNISKPASKGGLSVKQLQWLIKGDDRKSKLCTFLDEDQVMKVYDKFSPFVEIDKLGGL